jgi:hypothetical protein
VILPKTKLVRLNPSENAQIMCSFDDRNCFRTIPNGAFSELRSISEEFAPGISKEDFYQIYERLKKNAGIT